MNKALFEKRYTNGKNLDFIGTVVGAAATKKKEFYNSNVIINAYKLKLNCTSTRPITSCSPCTFYSSRVNLVCKTFNTLEHELYGTRTYNFILTIFKLDVFNDDVN
jgi:hypothetical protein